MSIVDDVFKIYKCKCGRDFIPHPNWLYKQIKNKKTIYYCSYTCWRKDGGDNGRKNHYAR